MAQEQYEELHRHNQKQSSADRIRQQVRRRIRDEVVPQMLRAIESEFDGESCSVRVPKVDFDFNSDYQVKILTKALLAQGYSVSFWEERGGIQMMDAKYAG